MRALGWALQPDVDLFSFFCNESVNVRQPGKLNKKFRNCGPCFCSGRAALSLPVSATHPLHVAQEYSSMMAERFTTFVFANPLPKAERKMEWAHCGRCAANVYLQNSGLVPASAGFPEASIGGSPLQAPDGKQTLPVCVDDAGCQATQPHEQPFHSTQPLPLTQSLLATLSLPRAQSPTPLGISSSSDQQQSFVQALTDLARLHSTGGLDADEFRMAKRKLLQL
jgi:hypothetical protein